MVRVDLALPKVAQLPPAEADIQELLYRFEAAVHEGAPCAFATLRDIWKEMRFAFLFQARPLHLNQEEFVQSLFASALDCLQVPLWPRKPRAEQRGPPATQPHAGASGEADAAESIGVIPSQSANMSVEDLVASDDEEDDPEHEHQIAMTLRGWAVEEEDEDVTTSRAAASNHDRQAAVCVEMPHIGTAGRATDVAAEEASPDRIPDLSALELLPDLHDEARQLGSASPGSPDRSSGGGASGGVPGDAQQHADGGRRRPREGASNSAQEQRTPVPEVVRIGGIFTLYALYFTQPSNPITRIYVPLQLLRGLTWMYGRSAESDAMLRRLKAENAFVIGAVRRPISGTHVARMAGKQAKSILHPDRMEQRRILRQAVRELKESTASLGSFQHTQLLCNSYKKAQERLWGSQQNLVQGLFDLHLGDQLGSMVDDLQKAVNKLLPYQRGSRFLAVQKDAPTTEAEEIPRSGQRPAEPKETEEDRAKAAQEAAARRQQRFSQADDEEMPSMEELGLSIPGSEGRSTAVEMGKGGIHLLPKTAQIVAQRKVEEQMEYRRTMNGWQQAFKIRNDQLREGPEVDAEVPHEPRNAAQNAVGEKPGGRAEKRAADGPAAIPLPTKRQRQTAAQSDAERRGDRSRQAKGSKSLRTRSESIGEALSGSLLVVAESAASAAPGSAKQRPAEQQAKPADEAREPNGDGQRAAQPGRGAASKQKPHNRASNASAKSDRPAVVLKKAGKLTGVVGSQGGGVRVAQPDDAVRPSEAAPPRLTRQSLAQQRAEALKRLRDADAEAAKLLEEL